MANLINFNTTFSLNYMKASGSVGHLDLVLLLYNTLLTESRKERISWVNNLSFVRVFHPFYCCKGILEEIKFRMNFIIWEKVYFVTFL